jgi:hypothetical protein
MENLLAVLSCLLPMSENTLSFQTGSHVSLYQEKLFCFQGKNNFQEILYHIKIN